MHRPFTLVLTALACALPVFASEGARRAIVPVVGSTAGAQGSNFRTSLELHNRSARPMKGTLLIRPASAGAPVGVPYSLAPHQTVFFEDIVASAGVSGLGSMDVYVEQGGVPTIVARAYDDKGSGGTTGVSVRPVSPADALASGDRGALIVPADLARFRFNIGVRSLAEGADVAIVIYNSDGSIAANLGTIRFAPDAFTQQPASQLLGGRTLAANQSIAFEVVQGAAIIYGTSTDNVTNDPSLQIASGDR